MKTHYKAFYKQPATGKPFTVVEAFRAIQMRSMPYGTHYAIMSDSLGTIMLRDVDAQRMIDQWNRAAQGRIEYSLCEYIPTNDLD